MPWRRRRRGTVGPVFAVPAWRMGFVLSGTQPTQEYCVDAYFVEHVETPFRRILLVYPSTSCRPVPSPSSTPLRGGVEDPERLFTMLVEGCEEAERAAVRPWRRGSLKTLLLGFHPEDTVTAEAFNAAQLCATVFGDVRGGHRTASLYTRARSYIEYRVGDLDSVEWRRLASLSKLEPRVAEAVKRIVEGLRGPSPL